MAFASGVIFIGHCQLFFLQVTVSLLEITVCLNDNTVLRTRTSIVSHLDQTILHATVERETTVAVLLPSLMVKLSRTVSICMLCVQLGLMRFHILDCLVDVIPPLSPMVQQPSWSSG